MAFLSPLFLWGIVAAAIPVAIHLFQRRTEPVVRFAAMRYLRQAPVEQSRWRRLKEMLLLALRAAALVMLAVAFARPYLATRTGAGGPVTLVLIDTSASMTAPGQFERARQIASDVIRSAPPAHAVAVAAFSESADLVADPSAGRSTALAAVSRLRPGAGATRYRVALARAAEFLGDRPGRIVVVTDLQQDGWDGGGQGGIPPAVDVDVRDVGAPRGNLAVRSLSVAGGEAVATIQNFANADVNAQLSFAVDGRTLAVNTVVVRGHGTADARVTLGRVSGVLSAAVNDPDGYVADNVRYAVLDGNAAPAVLAITPTGHESDFFYVERALSVGDGPGGFRIRAISGPSFSALDAGGLKDVDVVAILGTRGLDARAGDLLARFVNGGGGLLVTAGPDIDPGQLGPVVRKIARTTMTPRDGSALVFAPADTRHPMFRLFGGVGALGRVSFSRAALLSATAGADVVARYSDGSAAVVEEHVGSGRVLFFASDLNHRWNDFPVQPAFVPFLHETLRYLASSRNTRRDYLVDELPGEAGAIPGVVNIADRSGHARRVAVNVDPRESDPSRTTPAAFHEAVAHLTGTAARQATAQSGQAERGQRFWQVLLALMMVGLVVEGMLGRRLG